MADASIDALVREINWRNACTALGVTEETVQCYKSESDGDEEENARRELCTGALERAVMDAMSRWEVCNHMGIRLPWPQPQTLILEAWEASRGDDDAPCECSTYNLTPEKRAAGELEAKVLSIRTNATEQDLLAALDVAVKYLEDDWCAKTGDRKCGRCPRALDSIHPGVCHNCWVELLLRRHAAEEADTYAATTASDGHPGH